MDRGKGVCVTQQQHSVVEAEAGHDGGDGEGRGQPPASLGEQLGGGGVGEVGQHPARHQHHPYTLGVPVPDMSAMSDNVRNEEYNI